MQITYINHENLLFSTEVEACIMQSQAAAMNHKIHFLKLYKLDRTGEPHGYCIYYKDFWFRYQSYGTEINLAEILRKGQIEHTCPFVLPVTSKIFRERTESLRLFQGKVIQPNFHYRISFLYICIFCYITSLFKKYFCSYGISNTL